MITIDDLTPGAVLWMHRFGGIDRITVQTVINDVDHDYAPTLVFTSQQMPVSCRQSLASLGVGLHSSSEKCRLFPTKEAAEEWLPFYLEELDPEKV